MQGRPSIPHSGSAHPTGSGMHTNQAVTGGGPPDRRGTFFPDSNCCEVRRECGASSARRSTWSSSKIVWIFRGAKQGAESVTASKLTECRFAHDHGARVPQLPNGECIAIRIVILHQ